jgi:hypothetical protein
MSNPPPSSLSRLTPWILVSVLTILAIGLTSRLRVLQVDRDSLRTERLLAEIAARLAQGRLAERSLVAESLINRLGEKLRRAEDLARLKISVLAPSAAGSDGSQAVVIWDSEQQVGLLSAETLPATADTQDYQIWITDPAYPDPVNGGVFHQAVDGKAVLAFKPDRPVKQPTAFALSIEKKGGAPKAEGPILLRGK